MADAKSEEPEETVGKSRKGLILGLVLAVVGGGAAFAFTSGMISLGGESHPVGKADDIAFVAIDPMTVSVGASGENRYLRFRAELEVNAARKSEVEKLLPRVVDVLNTYLRSLSMADIEDPSSLLTLRSQMRRRIELVVGGDAVHDLLVMEFVVN